MNQKEAGIKPVYLIFVVVIIIATAFIAYLGFRPGILKLNISEKAVIVFSDSGKDTYLERFMGLYSKNTETVHLEPKYYEQYKRQRRIVLLGIKDSAAEGLIKDIIGKDFDEKRTYSIVKDNVSAPSQQVMMIYAPTEEDILRIINLSDSNRTNRPQDASVVAGATRIALNSQPIVGNVAGCTPSTAEFYIDNAIILGALPNQYQYIRMQIYDPLSSHTLSDIVPIGQKGMKQEVENIINDFKDQDVIVITAKCNYGGTFRVSMKISDFEKLDMEEWKSSMKESMCAGPAQLTVTTNRIKFAEIAQEYAAGRMNPENVLDWVAGKKDDFYDSLPKFYYFTQACPDFVPKIIITVLMPAFYDRDGNRIDYSNDWTTMMPNVDWDQVASYSAPVSQNKVDIPSGPASITYNFNPQSNVFYLLEVSTDPPGIFSLKKFFFGIFLLTAPVDIETKDGLIYTFDHWEVNGYPLESNDYVALIAGQYSKVVAHLNFTGPGPNYIPPPENPNTGSGQIGGNENASNQTPLVRLGPDLELDCAGMISKKEGLKYKIEFNITNTGNRKTDSGFWINMSNSWGWLESILYNKTLDVGQREKITCEYDESRLFANNVENIMMIDADSLDNITELNDGNNICNKRILKEHMPYADLDIKEFYISPSVLKKGEDIEIIIVVKNIGNATSNGFTVVANLGDQELGSEDVGLIYPGQSMDIKFKGKITNCGKQWFEIEINDVSPGDSNTMNNYNTTKLDVECVEDSCDSITDKYACSSGTCSEGGSCVWDASAAGCKCSSSAGTCLSVCGSDLGTCFNECTSPAYHQISGDEWCQTDRMSEDYMCCCTPR